MVMRVKVRLRRHLIEKNSYTHCVRFNGGPNAGHTIYVNNKKASNASGSNWNCTWNDMYYWSLLCY